MKKKRLMTSIVLLLMLISFMAPLSANTNTTIVSDIDYKSIQLDNDTLFEMAINGNLVKNSHTKVNVYYQNDGKDKIVEIKKLLSKKVYSDGTVEESNSDELIGTRYVLTDTRTGQDPGYTVRLTVGAQYDVKTKGDLKFFKVIKFWCTPTLLDGSFTLKSLSGKARAYGVSYDDNGPINNTSYLSTITNPANGHLYDKTTGFTRYCFSEEPPSEVYVQGTLKYGRGTSTNTYTLRMDID